MKTCTKCGETKEFSEFYKRKNGYRGDCKKCRNEYSSKWYFENKEHINALSKKWRLENIERYKKKKRELYQKKKDSITKRIKKWKINNREKVNASCAAARARKRNSIPSFVKDCSIEKNRIICIYNLCKIITKATGVEHNVDHMWPLADGGPHWSGNLQIIPAEENIKKRAKVDPAIKATIQEMLAEEERLHAEH